MGLLAKASCPMLTTDLTQKHNTTQHISFEWEGDRRTSSLRGDGEDAQLGAVVECAVCDHPDRRPQIQAADAGACNQRETKRGRGRERERASINGRHGCQLQGRAYWKTRTVRYRTPTCQVIADKVLTYWFKRKQYYSERKREIVCV